MTRKRRFFPFNAEQTINILSEFGPLATMFIVNAIWDINTGTWALILTTMLAIAVMFYMFGRPPIFPLIASTVTIVFGALTIVTGDPMWVQIKVTIFNAMFAAFLFIGLWTNRNFFQYVFGKTFHYTHAAERFVRLAADTLDGAPSHSSGRARGQWRERCSRGRGCGGAGGGRGCRRRPSVNSRSARRPDAASHGSAPLTGLSSSGLVRDASGRNIIAHAHRVD